MYIFSNATEQVLAWADANPEIVTDFIEAYKGKLVKTAIDSYRGHIDYFDIGVSVGGKAKNPCNVYRVPVSELYDAIGSLVSVKKAGSYGVKINLRGSRAMYEALRCYPVVDSFTWFDVENIAIDYGMPKPNAGTAWEIIHCGFSDKSGGLVDYVEDGARIQSKITMHKVYPTSTSAGEADLLTFPVCKIINGEPYVITFDNHDDNVVAFELHHDSKMVEVSKTRRYMSTALQVYYKPVTAE